jgi:hypothetical protein
MNTKTHLTKTTLVSIRKMDENHGDFPSWLVSKISNDLVTESEVLSNPSPALKGMLLKDEIGRKQRNPPWALVEYVIRELDPGHFNSFACLSVRGNNFVQCLRGFNGWHLEWRITNPSGNYVHYRACYPGGSKKPFELKKHNHVSGGQHRDLLDIDDVINAFRSFHQGHGLPGLLKWRKLDI